MLHNALMSLATAALSQGGESVSAGGGTPTLDAPAVAQAAAADDSGMAAGVILLIIIASFVVPLVLGSVLAKALRMREYAGRFGLIMFATWLGLAPFIFALARGESLKDTIRLGIDLAGGTNLIYEVDREELEKLDKTVDADTMNQMVGAIIRRINPSGTEEVTVRSVGGDGAANRIEVIVPGADTDKTESIKRSIVRLGSLEFAIIATTPDHGPIAQQAQNVERDLKNSEGNVIAIWRPITPGREDEVGVGSPYVSRVVTRDGEPVTEVLLIVNPRRDRRITGRLLRRSQEQISERGAVVGFSLNQQGGVLMQRLTDEYKAVTGRGYKHRLAILLDNQVYSAPTINSVIGEQGQIEGVGNPQERRELINVLNAGALEVPLAEEPVSEFTVSPLLGADVQEKGRTAILLAAAVVFVFMLVYYRAAGVVADICLVLNIILVLGVMSLIEATFTLPGLAGLVLTIGMAVDANVLIFERIREERAKGSSLRLSIQQGFGKAFSTIVDANVTTLITAVVLYMIGSDQVRGFAVTLFIGIVMSMFTSLYVGRVIFDVLERKGLIKDLSMTSLVSKTKLDFLSLRSIAGVVSAVLIVGGLISFFTRGRDNYDIDFRGGSMVTFRFEDEHPEVDVARGLLEPEFADTGMSLEELSVEDETTGEVEALYRLRTTEENEEKVARQISEAFDGSEYNLIKQTLATTDVQSSGEGEDEVRTTTATFGTPISPALARTLVADAVAERDANLAEFAADAVSVEAIDPDAAGRSTRFEVTVDGEVPADTLTASLASLGDTFADEPFFEEVNSFASAVAGETRTAAILAMIVSLVAIVAYIWIRFQRITFGLAAVVALVHDVLVVLGMVAVASYLSGNALGDVLGLSDFKINLPMIAAFLTIVGYSLNDTIVVFDRIREVRGKNPALTVDMVNTSLNQTLSRTLLTSLTTFIVVIILYALGGEGIHGFAFCLLLGVIVGTYSSIYVASPVLLWLMNRDNKVAVA